MFQAKGKLLAVHEGEPITTLTNLSSMYWSKASAHVLFCNRCKKTTGSVTYTKKHIIGLWCGKRHGYKVTEWSKGNCSLNLIGIGQQEVWECTKGQIDYIRIYAHLQELTLIFM